MKIAIVHDWLVNYMGSEKCVESFTNIWPESDVFTIVDFLKEDDRKLILKGKKAIASFIGKLPLASKIHRHYFPLFPLAVEQFDLSRYDAVISSSHAFAKGVLTHAAQIHICYCHTPVRYAWDLYHSYLKESGAGKGIKGLIARTALHYVRLWDYSTRNRPDYFIANSKYIARRIRKVYDRDASVIYPPVDTKKFSLCKEKEDYYVIAARFVPYKRVDLIVEAFTAMPDKKLLVIGDGPEEKKIRNLAGGNIRFAGYLPQDKLISKIGKAKAFLFAAEEDFGITIVEAQACGTPVIAFGRGGASETVIEGVSGVLFSEQTPASVIEAVNKFEKTGGTFDYEKIRKHAESFSREVFESKIKEFVELRLSEFYGKKI